MERKKIIDPLILPGMTSSSSHVPSMYGDDFLELVWQNGEILMQGGSSPTSSSKTRKRPSCIEDPCITKRARLNTGTFYFDSSHQNSQQTNINDQHFTKSTSFSFSNKTGGDEFSNLREGSKGSNSCKPTTTTMVGNTQLYYSSSSLSQYLGSDHQGINGKLNFSNFLRPALFVKSANLGNSATLPKNGAVSARALEEMKTKESHSLNEHPHHEDQKALTSPLVAKSGNEETVLPDQHSEAIIKTQGSHAQTHHRAKGKSATQPYSNERIVPSSSLCSLGASNDPTLHSRKHDQDTDDDSTYTSDNDEEPEDVIKQTPSREGSRGKRSRKAVIHNLSERKRRDKINKKMRALKELIPNCNKMDKASMLDDAIDYLKTLKLQLQVMSMGSGFCMPLMMLPSTGGGGGGGGHHILRPSGIGALPFSLPTHQFSNIPQLPSPHPTPITDNRLNMLAFQHPLMPLPFSPFLPMLPKNLPPNLSAHLTTLDDSLLPNNSDLNAHLVGANVMQPSNNQGTNRK